MDKKEYIERNELASRIKKYVKCRNADRETLECAKDECIRQAHCMPAADVAPKSETAKEILEEIEALATKHLAILEIINPQVSAVAAGGKHAFDLVLALTTELKKKYTEENDGT